MTNESRLASQPAMAQDALMSWASGTRELIRTSRMRAIAADVAGCNRMRGSVRHSSDVAPQRDRLASPEVPSQSDTAMSKGLLRSRVFALAACVLLIAGGTTVAVLVTPL